MLAFVGSITADPSRGDVGPGISVIWVDPSSGALRVPAFVLVRRLGRPHPLLNELDSTISVFAYDRSSAKLSILQTVSTVPTDFASRSAAAQIMVHPSGATVPPCR